MSEEKTTDRALINLALHLCDAGHLAAEPETDAPARDDEQADRARRDDTA